MTLPIAPHLHRLIELDALYPGFLDPPEHLRSARARRTTAAKQAAFAWSLSRLSAYTFDVLGHRHVIADVHRNPKVFGEFGKRKAGSYGGKRSCHKMKMAADLPIFKIDAMGRFQYKKTTPDHLEQGEFWEQLAEHTGFDLAWGGRFTRGDGNHFSHRIWGTA